MTKYNRAKRRIAADKLRKKKKQESLYASIDNFKNVMKMQNFSLALPKCQKGVRWKGSVQTYTYNGVIEMTTTIRYIERDILPKFTSIKRIELYERGKRRVIVPITIRDRMLQRVLCDGALVPRLRNTLIYDNGASLKDKGVEFTRRRLMRHLKSAVKEYGADFYILTFDFKSFFDSIPHRVCLELMEKYFTDPRIIKLTMDIIKSYPKSQLRHIEDELERNKLQEELDNNRMAGICLGSQISQIMALAVPNEIDHFIKDRKGVKHYIRYMDDGILLSDDKEFLHQIYSEMKVIADKLGLKFNDNKTKIIKSSKGFVFMKVKYRVTKSGKIVRTLTRAGIVRMRRKLKKFKKLVENKQMTLDDVYNSMQSWLGHSYVAAAYHTRKNMLKLYNDLFDGYKLTKKYEHVKGGRNNGILQIDKWDKYRWDCYAA